MGSASEAEYLLLLSLDLNYLEDEDLEDEDHESLCGRIVEVKRMLAALMQTVRYEPSG